MKDLIEERNFREKCARSIVKGYNVHYMTQEEIEAVKMTKVQAVQEEPKTETEPQATVEEKDRWADVPSAGYGKNEEKDPVTKEQIEKILEEQEQKFHNVM